MASPGQEMVRSIVIANICIFCMLGFMFEICVGVGFVILRTHRWCYSVNVLMKSPWLAVNIMTTSEITASIEVTHDKYLASDVSDWI